MFYCALEHARLKLVVLIQVQGAADCLGADCVPRYVDMKQYEELEVEHLFELQEASDKYFVNTTWICYFLHVFQFCLARW